MDMVRLRAWWSERQGLNDPKPGRSPAETLGAVGWARSVGGVGPYLTLFSRSGTSVADIHCALENQEIHELPCARGCTYIVPKEDYALALKVGQGFSDEAAMNTARKFLGVTDQEVEILMDKVIEALADGPLEPKGLKEKVGDAARSLGDEGKKRGQTSTLPLALGFLQSRGRIRRIPTNGRLDQQRYSYAIWEPSPLAGCNLTKEEAYAQLAEKYFRWAGPARLSHFQWFSGLGVGASKAAIANLDLRPIEGSDLLLPGDLVDEFQNFQVPSKPIYRLVSCIDSHLLLRRDLPNLIVDDDAQCQIAGEKGVQLVGGGLQDLSNHGILDRGRVVGVWEFDTEAGQIVWHSFVGKNDDLLQAIDEMENYIQTQLGDARSFSLDSPASRKPKIDALRKLSG
jgi:hypothetical protein